MLPSKYSTSPQNRRRPTVPTFQPPLGITGVVCASHNLEIPQRGKLHYTIYRPRMLRPTPPPAQLPAGISIRSSPPPLVCVAGGPGLSSQYLSVLVHHITDRAVVLFDALGCGQSTRLPQAKLTLDAAVDDVVALLRHLFWGKEQQQCCRFHLLGHSSGGILAYEAMSRGKVMRTSCASLILSNTPYNVAEALERRTQFCAAWNEEEDDDDDDNEGQSPASAHFTRHECRRTPIPLLLQQSLAQIRTKSSQSYDEDWETYQPNGDDKHFCTVPAALLISGQYDYVTDCDTWRDQLQSMSEVKSIRLAGTSHFSMVEDESLYGTVVSTFLKEYDESP